jgi:hypothetical protein
MRRHDATVVGADPAASPRSSWPRRAKAALVDQREFPREKACGDLAARAVPNCSTTSVTLLRGYSPVR